MFIAVHAAAAIAVTQNLGSPVLAGLFGLASHFVLDMVPHGDDVVYDRLRSRGWSKLKFGFIFGLPDIAAWSTLTYWLVACGSLPDPWVGAAAALGAALPDFLWGLATIFPRFRWLNAFDGLHAKSHHLLGRCLVRPWIGYGVQLATLAAAITLLQR